MNIKEVEKEVSDFAKNIIDSGIYDYAEIVMEGGFIDFYNGINCFTLNFVEGNEVILALDKRRTKLNGAISERQLKMLEKNPSLFMDLNQIYFMDNEEPKVYSAFKTNKLLAAANKGISKMAKSAERVEIQNKVMQKIESIKKETVKTKSGRNM